MSQHPLSRRCSLQGPGAGLLGNKVPPGPPVCSPCLPRAAGSRAAPAGPAREPGRAPGRRRKASLRTHLTPAWPLPGARDPHPTSALQRLTGRPPKTPGVVAPVWPSSLSDLGPLPPTSRPGPWSQLTPPAPSPHGPWAGAGPSGLPARGWAPQEAPPGLGLCSQPSGGGWPPGVWGWTSARGDRATPVASRTRRHQACQLLSPVAHGSQGATALDPQGHSSTRPPAPAVPCVGLRLCSAWLPPGAQTLAECEQRAGVSPAGVDLGGSGCPAPAPRADGDPMRWSGARPSPAWRLLRLLAGPSPGDAHEHGAKGACHFQTGCSVDRVSASE